MSSQSIPSSKKKVTAVIPARMAASRFPGKPLVTLLEFPMVELVRRKALLSSLVDEVYVATCDRQILETVTSFGGKSLMTADTHERCTDRVEEAAQKLDADIIVIVQGDEPLFLPESLDKMIKPMLSDDTIVCSNLLSAITEETEREDIDIVKAVLDRNDRVMYYSRAPIPFLRVHNSPPLYRQTGLSAFTKPFLQHYSKLPPTPLEVAESIDFLRILEHGFDVLGVITEQKLLGVDREEDVALIEQAIKGDPVQQEIYQRILKL